MAGYTKSVVDSLTDQNREQLNTWHKYMNEYRERNQEWYYLRAKGHIFGYTKALEDMGVITTQGRRALNIYYAL